MLKRTVTALACILCMLPFSVQARKKDKTQNRALYNSTTNIIRISPITALDMGAGLGMGYEKILGKDRSISIILPAYFLFDTDSYNNSYKDNYIYFTPGLKVYPFGQRKVTYALGPNLMLGYGKESFSDYNYNTNQYDNTKITHLRMGVIVNNYVNFNITPVLNLGLELGLGVCYIAKTTTERDFFPYKTTNYKALEPTGLFSMTLGFRF